MPIDIPSGVEVEIKETQADYCQLDGEGFPDHRPLIATFDITP